MPGRRTHSRGGRRRSSDLDRPLFCVATVPVSDTDAPAARQLGRQLYDVLTRPRGQPLTAGPGIPVAIGVDDAWRDRSGVDSLADHVLLVLTAGATSLLLDPVATWDRLNGPKPEHDGGLDPTPGREQKRLSKLLLATDPRWLAESSRGDAVAIAQTVLNLEDPRAGIDEVLLAIGGCLRATRKRPTLLISAASNWQTPLVIDPTVIARGRERWQLLKYFDAVKSAGDQRQAPRGTEPEQVLVSVQGPDREHDRVTQRDLIWARQRGIAIVVVEADRLGAVEPSSQGLPAAALPDLLRAAAVFKAGEVGRVPRSLLTADMRRAMSDETDVRIAIGGKSHPRRDVEDNAGYSGRFPGVAEEVYRAVDAGQPVYLCGGFGGITRRLTRLLDTPHDRDRFWQDESYRENPLFARISWDVDQDPRRALLGLPTSFRALADAICELAVQFGEDDDAWRNWNGLTLRQNRTLWQATEPVLVSSLIASGIASWRGRRNARDRNLRVEAIRGEITSVGNVDLLTLPVFDDIEPGGAGAAIDKLTGGLVRQGQSSPGSLVGVRGLELDVDYLCAVSLGRAADVMGDEAELKRRIEQAAHDVSELCLKEGFNSMAVVTYGGAVLKEHAEAVSAMLRGFNSAGGNLLIKWVERSEEKFNSLCETLRRDGGVDLTTVVQPIATPASVSPRWFQLSVSWHDNRLEVTLLPPDGNSGIPSQSVDLSHAQLEELSRGAGIGGTATPSMEELRVRGNELAELLLGDFAELMWQREPGLSLAIIHDAESSKISFEMLQLSDADVLQSAPAVRGGVHRWLAVKSAGELQELNPIPRVVIFNACQAARTRRGDPQALAYDSYSVAEWMLRAGVEAFVGTSWEVSDAAAADFARVLYKQLAAGETLRHAVTQGRRALAEAGKPDWANYVLYGDGRFRLT